MVTVLFIDLILSFSNALSAFLVISLTLDVLMLLFNMTLTGTAEEAHSSEQKLV